MDVVKRTLQRNGITGFVAVLFLDLGIVLPCPPICQLCSVSTVECEDVSSISDVLITLPSSTQQILLQQGNLSEIPPLSFSNFTNLYFLSITGFLISSLADFTFFTPYVNPLKILDLSHNQLLSCTIEPLAFSGLLYLEELILTNNSLDVLRGTWFMEMPNLKKLCLALNRITYLPPRTFENLNTLDELVVSSNMIQYLPMDAFFGLVSLTKLDLSINKILFINQEAFQPLQVLQDLLLFQNRLTTLPTFPDSINFLLLHKNPWLCNCQLIQSMQVVEAKIQTPTGVTCKSPPFLSGHQVTSSKILGCAPSPSSSLSSPLFSAIDFPPSRSGTFKLICGLLGGFFLGLTVGLFCCYCLPKCCGGRSPFAIHSKNEKALSSSWVKPSTHQEGKTSDRDPQILSGLPAAESSAMALEGGHFARGTCCGPLVSASQILYGEQLRFQSPLVAYLSVDPMGRSIVTLREKGHETRCPVFGQPCYPVPQDDTHKRTEVSRDGGTQEQHSATCMHGLRGSCVPPTARDQIARKQSGLGEHVDHLMNVQILHPKIHVRDTQPLPALVHIDFPDGCAVKIEQNRTASHTSPSMRNESHQGGSPTQASPGCLKRKRNNCGHPRHRSQAGFTSPESEPPSELRHWQESWTGRKAPRRSDLHLSFASTPNKRQTWKPCPSHPTHEVTSTPSLSSVSSQPEACRFHYWKEPCPEGVPRHPGKRARAFQELEKAQQAGDTILTHRKSRSRQEDSRFLTRKESTLSRIWKCRNCGCEGSAPCPVNPRRCAQPGAGSRRTFIEASTQWSSTDAVHLKENEFALTFLGVPHNVAKTRSEERWLAACFPDFQPSSVQAIHPGEVDSIYEYPSPLVSTTAFDTASVLVEDTVMVPILKHQDLSTDFLNIPQTKPTAVMDPLLGQLPPEKIAFRSLSEALQPPEEILLETLALGREELSEESQEEPMTPSPTVSAFSFRTDTSPSLQELPLSIMSCSQVTFSAIPGDSHPKTPSVMTICPLVQKMFQIDFPLPAEEEEEKEEEAKPFQGGEWDG
ncbi:uncharacterized protein LOC120300736 [Crotalus tigris]|uniref:uncharacterized protein LOC120300736 n=1 Tax=Crotalus tigris TaxID=88082 RepID=UPI00192FA8FC|nr:uncharacterized protein LOC120300736 [Crotalus tigris]